MADTGSADLRLVAALDAWQREPGPAHLAQVHAALVTARVFAAVTATNTAEHLAQATGLRAESSAQMALVTLVAGDGAARALPVFLDAAGAVSLREGTRPVPRTGPEACAAALDDGCSAVLFDPRGAALVVAGSDLQTIAAGQVPVAGAPLSTRRTAHVLAEPGALEAMLVSEAAAALRGEAVRHARLLAGPDGLVLGIVPERELDAAALVELAARILPRLPGAVLDLAVIPERGPGVAVPLTSARAGWRGRRMRESRSARAARDLPPWRGSRGR